ncbi:CDP-diacylglycerol--serine O-phosphatidyltransferase [Methanosphaera sp.]|uniref:CDP-diacylglycerol--serine O-phosphatidyltransferase n=1 Tax=Methanosphaera sp. TaxID=2666342 RepID=UPI002E7AA96E|nr:CDP-diacylglycerol--serine O-phosphatidyltransferase [Methanosphaera sp.]MEE1118249.1 CDP-diacylglycerol--serine O-phosphatidyltransferase [Methanosphaera sp.]
METNILKMVGIADIASLLNAVSGMLAIIMAFYQNSILSALFLILAVVFDAIDGPLARRFPSPSKDVFGETMDSLADAISFGIAPAIIIFELFNTPLMIIASILLLCCGILRLSRYNTIITEQEGPTKTFIGLPIPVSSFMLSLLLFSQINQASLILIIMSVIAILMISTLEYPKIKNIKIFGVCGLLLLVTLILPLNNMLFHIPSIILIILVLGYLILPFTNIKI